MALLSSLWLTGCSVLGISEVAEPPFTVLAGVGKIEIRDYPPRVVAETTVQESEAAARNTGFRRIAGYIFGGNHDRTKIAMTAPVAQQHAGGSSRKIPMTAPVSQGQAGPNGWTIRFFMPTGSTIQTLPEPNDANVKLVQLPAQTFAVLRFSGSTTPTAVAREDAKLLRGLAGSGWSASGTPVAWFYNPPWTLPPLRRNEVAVPVSRTG
ncbi:SOUL family heme-binding protein [Lichenicoccus sp.]|uniref:SOUL family heme-binding protein n=1 Tax=Lichenicoccus sp. TaxID=2781899 RepID=UPI003D13CC16